jgi:hypothetical protein
LQVIPRVDDECFHVSSPLPCLPAFRPGEFVLGAAVIYYYQIAGFRPLTTRTP